MTSTSYIGIIYAAQGKYLYGGVKEHRSSPFETYKQAEDWLYAACKDQEVARTEIRAVFAKNPILAEQTGHTKPPQ